MNATLALRLLPLALAAITASSAAPADAGQAGIRAAFRTQTGFPFPAPALTIVAGNRIGWS